MLLVAQLEALEKDDGFRNETQVGLRKIFGDLCRAIKVFRITEEGVREYVGTVSNTRDRRQEFSEICVRILARLLNAHSPWRCDPSSVRALFDAEQVNASWLAFEVPHVKAILSRVEAMLCSHRIQAAVLRVSGLAEEQVVGEMHTLSLEIHEAREATIQVIENEHVTRTMGITLLERGLRSGNPDSIKAMVAALSGGALGAAEMAEPALENPPDELPIRPGGQ